MNAVHLAAIDLNLLVVLHVLLATRSTSAAATRLGRTQSAVSHALRRLRDLLDDPLFVRVGGHLEPTDFAAGLGPALDAILTGVDTLLRGADHHLDPARLVRRFTVGATDIFGVAVLPRLVVRLQQIAPGVDLEVRPAGERPLDEALLRREIDVAYGVRFQRAGITSVNLADDDMVVVLRKGHPALRRPLTLDAYCALGHIVVAPRGAPGSVIDTALEPLGRSRRVVLRVPHFATAALVVSQTDLVTAMPRSTVRTLRVVAPFVERTLPLESPVFPFQIAVASTRVDEPALAWFSREVVAASRGALGTRRDALYA